MNVFYKTKTRQLQTRIIYLLLLTCLSTCMAYGTEVIDHTSEQLRRQQMQADINLQHSMMQDQINAMYHQNYNSQPYMPRYNAVDVNRSDYSRPTYTVDTPLYKFGQ